MIGALAIALALSGSSAWVEVRTGQPASDDITYAGYPEGPGVLWIGTSAGEAYRSSDQGTTWEWVFGPRSVDNLIDIQLRTLRVPTLHLDLLRDARTDLPVRDRAGANRRVLDLARQARDRQRLPHARVLGALVSRDVVDDPTVLQVVRCFDYLYITARNGVWRSQGRGAPRFDMLAVGGDTGSGNAIWVSCDVKHPGHLVVTTPNGSMLESEDFGDTWHPFHVPFDRNSRISFAIFFDGRVTLLAQGRIYREREDQRGFEPTCESQVDMVESKVSWAWNRLGPIFATGIGGVTVCDSGKIKRYSGETMALEDIYYFQTQGDHDEHVMIVTQDDVYISHDAGKTFTHEFRRPTTQNIGFVLVDDLSTFEDATIWAGNTIWKRVPEQRGSSPAAAIAELERQAPMADVVESALRIAQLDGQQVAARRNDSRLQGLLPLVRASYNYRETGTFVEKGDVTKTGIRDASDPFYFNRTSYSYPERAVWTVIAVWDVSELLRSLSSTDRGWADVQRLHRIVAYEVEDHYMRWMNARLALTNGALTATQRALLLVSCREDAAYLDYMTGGRYPVFH